MSDLGAEHRLAAEQRARVLIDRQLTDAGWLVQECHSELSRGGQPPAASPSAPERTVPLPTRFSERARMHRDPEFQLW